jgi:O-antigen ligase
MAIKGNIEQVMARSKLSLLITAATSFLLLLLTYLFKDIIVSLSALFVVFIGIVTVLLIIKNAFWGLILIIFYGYFNNFLEIPMITSGAMLIGIIVAIGWFLKYFMRKQTLFFDFLKFNRILLALILFMVISSSLASAPTNSFKVVLKITMFISIIFFIQDFIRKENDLDILIAAVALSAGIASILGLVQFVLLRSGQDTFGNILYTNTGEFSRLGGIDGANSYAQALMTGIPFLTFLSFNHRKLFVNLICFSLLITSIICLGLTGSRTNIVGFLVFVVVYVLLNIKYKIMSKKYIAFLLIFGIVLFIILSTFLLENMGERSFEMHDNSTDIRFNIFSKGVELLMEYPLFGIGFDNLKSISYDKMGDLYGRDGHDIVSSVFTSIGLLGSLTLIFMICRIMKYLFRAAKLSLKQNDKYLVCLIITLLSAFIAQLSLGVGNAVILSRIFWIYSALAVVIYRWSTLQNGRLSSAWPKPGMQVIALHGGVDADAMLSGRASNGFSTRGKDAEKGRRY